MTTYLLAVHMVEGQDVPPDDVVQVMYQRVATFNEKLQAEGSWVFAGGLEPPTMATVVDASKGGDALITDGPFAEAKEQLGGFWVLELPDLDVALEVARQASEACGGPVEVRPFQAD